MEKFSEKQKTIQVFFARDRSFDFRFAWFQTGSALQHLWRQHNRTTERATRASQLATTASQHPLTTNPLLVWGVQAIQSAASQTMNGLPAVNGLLMLTLPWGNHYLPNHPILIMPLFRTLPISNL